MADPVLTGDLRARLTAAAHVCYLATQPDEATISLAADVQAAGGCADIATATSHPHATPTVWRHEVCIRHPEHLGYHELTDGMECSLDRMEYERRAERTIADLAKRRLADLLDALYPDGPPTVVDDEAMHAAVQHAAGLHDAIGSFEHAAAAADRVRADASAAFTATSAGTRDAMADLSQSVIRSRGGGPLTVNGN